MNVDVRTPRGSVVSPDCAEIAAIVVAVSLARARPLAAPPHARGEGGRWRTAGRTYDTYEREGATASTKRGT